MVTLADSGLFKDLRTVLNDGSFFYGADGLDLTLNAQRAAAGQPTDEDVCGQRLGPWPLRAWRARVRMRCAACLRVGE
jgi:hypothetical protein